MGRVTLFVLLAMVSLGRQASAELLPAAAYGRLPNVQSMEISPNGERVAFLAGNEKTERSVVVFSLNGGAPNRIPLNGERAVDVTWLSDERVSIVLYKYTERPGGTRATYNDVRRLIVDIDGSNPVEIRPAVSAANYLPDDPDNILVVAGTVQLDERARSSTEFYQRTDVYQYNIKRGKAKRVISGREGTVDWILTPEGEPVIRIDQRTDSDLSDTLNFDVKDTQYFAKLDGGWKRIKTVAGDPDDGDFFQIAGFREGEKNPYLIGRQNKADKIGLYRLSLEDGEVTGPLFEPDRNDLSGVMVDRYKQVLVGYQWVEGQTRRQWWDPELEAIHNSLQAVFPGSELNLASWDRARNRFIVYVNGGDVAQNYYLFEPEMNKLRLLARAYPDIPDNQAHPVSYIQYEARDGLKINAYLTLPKGREPKNLPMVVLPHGGPEARDFPGFDYWPQFLASRGYAVVQPQFRHSSGFGRHFARLGYGRWGQEMQTDLSDVVAHLSGEGVIDASRVCIFGWSYGGYAALAGATITPQDYRCAVAGAPVSDLPKMLRWVDDYYGSNSGSADYWRRAIGSRFAASDQLETYSPARLIDYVRAPIMLIHGEIDLIVPIEQSEIMANALEQANKPYEFVRLEGENHNILYGETRIQMMEALERFLLENNPPN